MPASKEDIKNYVHEWITQRISPFTTDTVQKQIPQNSIGKTHLSPKRLKEYIRTSGKVFYDPNKREWFKKPVIHQEGTQQVLWKV